MGPKPITHMQRVTLTFRGRAASSSRIFRLFIVGNVATILWIWFVLLSPVAVHAADQFQGSRFYFGDLHIHTGVSHDGFSMDIGRHCSQNDPQDECLAVADLVDNARANGLDFVSITDHVNGGMSLTDEQAFNTVYQIVIDGHAPDDGFITIPGVELHWSDGNDYYWGHRNLYFFGENEQLTGLELSAVQFDEFGTNIVNCDNMWLYMDSITAQFGPALLLPHHMNASNPPDMGGDWSCSHPVYAPSAEVYSEHGNSMRTYSSFEPMFGSQEQPGLSIQDALDPKQYGLKIGFYSSTDNHASVPGGVCSHRPKQRYMKYGGGLAVAVLDASEEFSREAVLTAMTQRKTYATSGPRLPVLIEYQSDGEWVGEMGDILDLRPGAGVLAHLSIPAEYETAVTSVTMVVLDDIGEQKQSWQELQFEEAGEGTWTLEMKEPASVFYPLLRIDGEVWYGEDGCDDGGKDTNEQVWLSPSWVHFKEAVAKSDGWSADANALVTDTDTLADSAVEQPEREEQSQPEGCGCLSIGGAGPGGWLLTMLLTISWRRCRGRSNGEASTAV